MSLHPTMSNAELIYTIDAIEQLALNHKKWAKDFDYSPHTNEFRYNKQQIDEVEKVKEWFEL